jgi:NADPH:quinone reductase-like Zn-dependent oxidoreductase
MVHRIPDGMSFGTAASLPVVYSTAHYALHYAAGLRAGESILIHGAAGGTFLFKQKIRSLKEQRD